MKILSITLLISLVAANIVAAKWRPLNLNELNDSTDFIVIAEFISEHSHKKTNVGVEQIVIFKVIKNIKGNTDASIFVYGSAMHICKAQYYFPKKKGDRYLLFLRTKKDVIKEVVNGQFGALPITNQSVNWFKDTSSISGEREPKTIVEVLKQIE
jgi:hypothetical protein